MGICHRKGLLPVARGKRREAGALHGSQTRTILALQISSACGGNVFPLSEYFSLLSY